MKEEKIDLTVSGYDLGELCHVIAENIDDEDIRNFIIEQLDNYDYDLLLKALYDPLRLVMDEENTISSYELADMYNDHTEFFNKQAKKLNLKLDLDFDIDSYDSIIANFIQSVVVPVLEHTREKTRPVYIKVMNEVKEQYEELFDPAHRPIVTYVVNNTNISELPDVYEELFYTVTDERIKDLIRDVLQKMTLRELEEVIDTECNTYRCVDVAKQLAKDIYNRRKYAVTRVGGMYYVGNVKYKDKDKVAIDLPEGKLVLPKGIWKVKYYDVTSSEGKKEECIYTSNVEIFRKKMSSDYELVSEYTFQIGNSVEIFKHDGILMMPQDMDIRMYSAYDENKTQTVFPFLFTKATRSYHTLDKDLILKRVKEDFVFVRKLYHVNNSKENHTIELLVSPPSGKWILCRTAGYDVNLLIERQVDSEDNAILDLFDEIRIETQEDLVIFKKEK